MGITVAGQTVVFLGSLVFGAFLGIVYDVFRIGRSYCGNQIMPFFLDLLFWLLAGILTFFYLLAADEGQIRGFVLLGELVGIVVYMSAVGNALFLFGRGVISGTGRLFSRIFRPIVKKTGRFGRAFRRKFRKNSKNIFLSFKYRLKRIGLMVYNNKNRAKKGKVETR